jgi:hypothetical protein
MLVQFQAAKPDPKRVLSLLKSWSAQIGAWPSEWQSYPITSFFAGRDVPGPELHPDWGVVIPQNDMILLQSTWDSAQQIIGRNLVSPIDADNATEAKRRIDYAIRELRRVTGQSGFTGVIFMSAAAGLLGLGAYVAIKSRRA